MYQRMKTASFIISLSLVSIALLSTFLLGNAEQTYHPVPDSILLGYLQDQPTAKAVGKALASGDEDKVEKAKKDFKELSKEGKMEALNTGLKIMKDQRDDAWQALKDFSDLMTWLSALKGNWHEVAWSLTVGAEMLKQAQKLSDKISNPCTNFGGGTISMWVAQIEVFTGTQWTRKETKQLLRWMCEGKGPAETDEGEEQRKPVPPFTLKCDPKQKWVGHSETLTHNIICEGPGCPVKLKITNINGKTTQYRGNERPMPAKPEVAVAGTDVSLQKQGEEQKDGSKSWDPEGEYGVWEGGKKVVKALVEITPERDSPMRTVRWKVSGAGVWEAPNRNFKRTKSSKSFTCAPGFIEHHLLNQERLQNDDSSPELLYRCADTDHEAGTQEKVDFDKDGDNDLYIHYIDCSDQSSFSPPNIDSIEGPSEIPGDNTGSEVKVSFTDPDADLKQAKIWNNDSLMTFDPGVKGQTTGDLSFSVSCKNPTGTPRNMSTSVQLVDEQGLGSDKKAFHFTCLPATVTTESDECLSDEFASLAKELFGKTGVLQTSWQNDHHGGLEKFKKGNYEQAINAFESYLATLNNIVSRLKQDADGNGTVDIIDKYGVTDEIQNKLYKSIESFEESIAPYEDFVRLRKLAAQAFISGNPETGKSLVEQSNQAVDQHVDATDEPINTLQKVEDLLMELPCRPTP